MPKVSIVIPVFNGSDYLHEAIDSALAQTYPNIEIVVVNDGSRDEGATERIALSYGTRIRYYSQENGGVASALNTAIEKMSGEYFSWLSHDDLYTPNKVEVQIRALAEMEDRNRVILYSDFAAFTNDPNQVNEVHLPEVPPENFRYFLTVDNSLHGCTLLVPKIAFDECGTFNENLRTTQDYDLWFRLAEKFHFVHIPAVLVKARRHAAQGSIAMKDAALAECNALLDGFARNLSRKELATATNKPTSQAYAEISASFGRRGLHLAARNAASLSLRSLGEGSIKDALVSVIMLFRTKLIIDTLRTLRWFRSLLKLFGIGVKKMFARIKNKLLRRKVSNLQLKDKFSLIYAHNLFVGKESRSGGGSDMVQTEEIRRVLPNFLQELHIQTLLDAPCGDYYWMRETPLGVNKYIGADIVEKLVEKNQHEFGDETHEFICRNLAQDELPRVDIIFCRDCLVHLNNEDVKKVLLNFKRSGSKYLLTTTFPGQNKNFDLIGEDIWRALNLQAEPFNFPLPLKLINEKCTEGTPDKSLGLWRLSDIEVA